MTTVAESTLAIPGYDAYLRPFEPADESAFIDMRLATPGYGLEYHGDDMQTRREILGRAFHQTYTYREFGAVHGVWTEGIMVGKIGASTEGNIASIDYLLRESHRGVGLGEAAVGRFCEWMLEDKPSLLGFVFLIYPENDRSQNLASKLGAQRGSTKEYDYDVWRLSPNRFRAYRAKQGATL